MIKPLQRAEELADNLFDSIDQRLELRKDKKRIKKICKKYALPSFLLDMYSMIQEDIHKRAHTKDMKEGKMEDFDKKLYQTLVFGRVYELNKEILLNIPSENFHSSYALARQMTDLYIRTLYVRIKPEYLEVISGKSNKSFPDSRQMIEAIKKSSIDLGKFKWTEEATRDKFIDTIYDDFCFFSELFHPTINSFASNVWVVDNLDNREIKETKLYKDAHQDLKNKSILTFPLKSPVPAELVQRIFHQFFTYSSLILYNLDKITEEVSLNK